MALMITRDGLAERLTPLSGKLRSLVIARESADLKKDTGNPADHLKVLQNKKKLEARGSPSLQNVLQLAKTGLSCVECSVPRPVRER